MNTIRQQQFEPAYDFEALRTNERISNDTPITPNVLNFKPLDASDSQAVKKHFLDFLKQKIKTSLSYESPTLYDSIHRIVDPENERPLTKHQIIHVLDETNRLLEAEKSAASSYAFSREEATKKYFSEHPFLEEEKLREVEANLHADDRSNIIVEYDATKNDISLKERSFWPPEFLLSQQAKEELQLKTKKTYEILKHSFQHRFEKKYGLEAAQEMTEYLFRDIDKSKSLTKDSIASLSRLSRDLKKNIKILWPNTTQKKFAKSDAERTSPTQPTAVEIVRLAISLRDSKEIKALEEALPQYIRNELTPTIIMSLGGHLIAADFLWSDQSDTAAEIADLQLEPILPVPPEVTDHEVTEIITQQQQFGIGALNEQIASLNETIEYNSELEGEFESNDVLDLNAKLIEKRDLFMIQRDQLEAKSEGKILDTDLFNGIKNYLVEKRDQARELILQQNEKNAAINAELQVWIPKEQARLLAECEARSLLVRTITSYLFGFPLSFSTMKCLYNIGKKAIDILKARADERTFSPIARFEKSLLALAENAKNLTEEEKEEAKSIDQNAEISRQLIQQGEHLEHLLEEMEEDILTPFTTVEEHQPSPTVIQKSSPLSEQEEKKLKTLATIKEVLIAAKEVHVTYCCAVSNAIRNESSNATLHPSADLASLEENVNKIHKKLQQLVNCLDDPRIADAIEAFCEYQAAARQSTKEMMEKTIKMIQAGSDFSKKHETVEENLRKVLLTKEPLPVIPGAPKIKTALKRDESNKEELATKTSRYQESLQNSEHRQANFSEELNRQMHEFIDYAVEYYQKEAKKKYEELQKFRDYRRTHLPI